MKRGILFLFLFAFCFPAYAGPSVPSGCTTANATIVYNGDNGMSCGSPSRPIVAVSGLPSCATATKGAMYLVTDALVPVALNTVAGSGAVVIGVTCNGTNWIVQ